jgi:DNA-directed RNA polymerase specialized sigma24 family protein
VCRTFSPHWEDLRQELFLLLVTKLHDKAVKAMEGENLEYYYIRCAANLTRPLGKVTRLLTVYDSPDVEELDLPDEETTQTDDCDKLAAISEALMGAAWYESSLFQMYADGLSAWEIHRQTRIPIHSVRAVINDVKRKAREVLKNSSC